MYTHVDSIIWLAEDYNLNEKIRLGWLFSFLERNSHDVVISTQ